MLLKRNALLPFYKSDQLQDWELSGYYKEFLGAIQLVPQDVLVSFRTPIMGGAIATDPTSITLRKLSIINGVKTILESKDYNVTINRAFVDSNYKLTTQANASYTYYYFNQSKITENAVDFLELGCIYEIYLEDAFDNKFISNIFVAIEETEIFIYAENGLGILTEDGQNIVFQ